MISAQGSAIDLEVRSPLKTVTPFSISVNNARVIKANVQASNGILHAIDTVLLNDLWLFKSYASSVYAIIASNPQLSTLKAVLDQNGLDQALQNPNALYTVLAPTNDAFNDPILGSIGVTDPSILKNVLVYHVLQ